MAMIKLVNGFSIVELLVAVGVSTITISLIAFLSTRGKLTRGGIEKQTESYKTASYLGTKFFKLPWSEIEFVCKEAGALGTTKPDPCLTSKGQLKIIGKKGQTPHWLLKYFDTTIQSTSFQNAGVTKGAPISCVHIQSCNYILTNKLIEVKLSYHWHDPLVDKAQSQFLSFRRGIQ